MGRVLCIGAAVLSFCAIFAASASAALQGPVYPVPGGDGTGHGGNTCYAKSDNDGAGGKNNGGAEGIGQTWVYGRDNDTTPQVGCAPDLANPTPLDFDTTRFDALYWGAKEPPAIALDGDIDEANETLVLAPNTGAPASDYANGRVVWTGTSDIRACSPGTCVMTNSVVNTRLVLTIKDQSGAVVPLTDASTVAGITNPSEVGAVVAINGGSVTRFSANWLFEAEYPAGTGPAGFQPALDMYNTARTDPAIVGADGFRTHMSFGGGFWFEGKDPTAEFTFPTPANGQPVTFTSTSSDPDGGIASLAWDLDNDGQFDDDVDNDPTAQSTYGPGTHTVNLQVTDPDGETDTVSHQFTITNALPTANFTFPTPTNGAPVTFTSTSSDSDGTIATQAWDLDNDGQFDDGAGSTATSTYGPGSHTVRLQVTDNNGGIGTVSKSFTIATPPDTTKPVAKLTLTAAKLGKIIAKGLKGKLNLNEAGRTVLKVTLPKALGKKLGLTKAIGSVTVTHTAAGNKNFTIKLKAKAKRKLRSQRSVKFIVTGAVSDTAGNKSKVTKSMTARK